VITFAAWLALLISVWDVQFALTATEDISLGALAIFSQVLGIAISFVRGLIRG